MTEKLHTISHSIRSCSKKILTILGIFFIFNCAIADEWDGEWDFEPTELYFAGPVIQKGKKFETLLVKGPTKLFKCKLNGDVKILGRANFKQCGFEGKCIINGRTEAFDSTFKEEVEVNGRVKIQNCIIKNSCEINGRTELSDSTFASKVELNGRSRIQKCIFTSNCDLNGHANVLQSKFKSNVIFNGDSTVTSSTLEKGVFLGEGAFVFSNCKIGSIQLEKPRPLKTQTIELNKGTVVTQSITFESGKGEVILREGSEVKGKVIGGKIIKK